MSRPCDVTVIGAGSWGTALAITLARNGHPTSLWGRDENALAAIARTRINAKYLPGHHLPPSLEIETTLAKAAGSAGAHLVAVPSHGFANLIATLSEIPACRAGVLWATKGLDPSSGRLLHEVAEELLPAGTPVGILSGPTFAGEVARQLPTAVTLASPDPNFARAWATRLTNSRFRVYTSDDIIGVQVAGAVKNVLAIAAGISDGLGFGANTRAALIARGLSELARLGEAAGGKGMTFMGLAGLGDLLLTSTDDQSRNRRLGLALASRRAGPRRGRFARAGRRRDCNERTGVGARAALRSRDAHLRTGSGGRGRCIERRRGGRGAARTHRDRPGAMTG